MLAPMRCQVGPKLFPNCSKLFQNVPKLFQVVPKLLQIVPKCFNLFRFVSKCTNSYTDLFVAKLAPISSHRITCGGRCCLASAGGSPVVPCGMSPQCVDCLVPCPRAGVHPRILGFLLVNIASPGIGTKTIDAWQCTNPSAPACYLRANCISTTPTCSSKSP